MVSSARAPGVRFPARGGARIQPVPRAGAGGGGVMEIRAAVLYEANTPLVVEPVRLDDPKRREVLVRIGAAGVCHSDYHVMKGEWRPPLPMVLGHEASGTVERVGAGVERVRPGDRVILNFRPNCGWCDHCSRGEPVLCNGSESDRWLLFDGTTRLHTLAGRDLHHFARVASFAEYAVVPESGAVPVRRDVPLDAAALIGCSVMTGSARSSTRRGSRPAAPCW